MSDIVQTLADPQTLLGGVVAVGVVATVLSIGLPLLERNEMATRMKAVAGEREKIRARERARLVADRGKSLRAEPKAYMKSLVDKFQLKQALADENTADRLRQAGFRGQAPLTVFLFARFVMPFAAFAFALFYLFVLARIEMQTNMKFVTAIGAAAVGFYLPNLYIQNAVTKRQGSIRRAWPDALDLLLICIESGMSIEPSFRRVAEEIGAQSLPLAEEMSLTAAELSFLQERRQAYENLAALIQAERYGTPLGQALRVLSQESRTSRLNDAEKKAAALPPKLTVPMILFFLPVLFMVIIGPAMIQLFNWK